MTVLDNQEKTIAHSVIEAHDLTKLGDVPSFDVRIAYESTAKAVDWVIKQKCLDLLVLLLDAGLPAHARFGGLLINGLTVKANGADRDSMMMMCVKAQFGEGLALLLERGANVPMSCSDYGTTILDRAMEQNWLEGVQIILAHCRMEELYGPNKMSKTDGLQAPVNMFDVNDYRIIDALFVAGVRPEGVLRRACERRDNPVLVKYLMGLGCDLNEPGQEAIVAAATNGHVKTLQLLLEEGADASVKNERGRSLMQCANNFPEVKSILRSWKTGQAISSVPELEGAQDAVKRSAGMAPL